jgi:hypothetical protein
MSDDEDPNPFVEDDDDIKIETPEEIEQRQTAAFSGACPHCHSNNGLVNVGRAQWLYCSQHRVRWRFASNFGSAWRRQSWEEQMRICNDVGFFDFEEVIPWCPPSWKVIGHEGAWAVVDDYNGEIIKAGLSNRDAWRLIDAQTEVERDDWER